MNEYFEKFKQLIEAENKQQSVEMAMNLLEKNKIDVITLYTQVLTPVLNNMECLLADKTICVWKEHVRTAIVRTIVECCYPYVVKQREKQKILTDKIAVVICPPEEYHDLGARMVTDLFTICGYESVFVGGNTPYQDFYNANQAIKPDIIAISVSSFYSLIVTKKIISDLKKVMPKNSKIVVGGNAIMQNQDNVKMLGADYFANSFEDIQNIASSEDNI
jgi:methanogenic corrinoid protein MtbC1